MKSVMKQLCIFALIFKALASVDKSNVSTEENNASTEESNVSTEESNVSTEEIPASGYKLRKIPAFSYGLDLACENSESSVVEKTDKLLSLNKPESLKKNNDSEPQNKSLNSDEGCDNNVESTTSL